MDETEAGLLRAKIVENTRLDGQCLIWTGGLSEKGYGRLDVTLDGKVRNRRVHRIIWELQRGPIPDGMVLDHTCYNRACWNLHHLHLVTVKQNNENRDPATSRYRGTSWNSAVGKWKVSVKHHGIAYHGGYFDDRDEAARVAREMRARLFSNSLGDALLPA